jgi:hypothetical protein
LDYFGLELPRVIDFQGIAQIQKMLVHGAIPSPMGHFLSISLELAQIKVGTANSIFATDFDDYGFLLMDCWIKSLREFVSRNDITLQNLDQVLLQVQHEGDGFIMDEVIAL